MVLRLASFRQHRFLDVVGRDGAGEGFEEFCYEFDFVRCEPSAPLMNSHSLDSEL